MFESDVSVAERQVLYQALGKFKSPQYLEIGVNKGGTFKAVLDYFKQYKPNAYAVGVDLWEDLQRGPGQTHLHLTPTRAELLQALEGYTNFELVKGNSDTMVAGLDRIFDVIFIDGNHTYTQTKIDFEASILKTKPGSVILFHNATEHEYPNDGGGPWKVCTELLQDARVQSIHTPRLSPAEGIFDRTWAFEVVGTDIL